jgi:N-acetylneuraminic acid mutarotase
MRLFQGLLICSQLLNGQSWVRQADFPGEKRDDGVAVTVGEKAYVGTGLKEGWTACRDFYCWDFTTSAWTSIAEMPQGSERQYACIFEAPGGFFVFGGDNYGPLNDLYYYDITTNLWLKKSPKPGGGLSGAVALSFGDEVVICGGRNNSGRVSSEVWQYTISDDRWTKRPDLPGGGRWRASGTVCDKVAYLAGGLDDNGAYRREIFSYHPLTDQWSIQGLLPGAGRAYTTLRAIDDRYILLFGGQDTSGTFHSDLWKYSPVPGTWSRLPDIPSAGRRGDMSCTLNNTFLYSCGLGTGDARLKETWTIKLPDETDNERLAMVFPNPTGGNIYIRLPPGIFPGEITCSIWIPNILLRLSPTAEFGHMVIDFSDLAGGIYVLILEWPGHRETHRIVRQ